MAPKTIKAPAPPQGRSTLANPKMSGIASRSMLWLMRLRARCTQRSLNFEQATPLTCAGVVFPPSSHLTTRLSQAQATVRDGLDEASVEPGLSLGIIGIIGIRGLGTFAAGLSQPTTAIDNRHDARQLPKTSPSTSVRVISARTSPTHEGARVASPGGTTIVDSASPTATGDIMNAAGNGRLAEVLVFKDSVSATEGV